MRESQLEHQQPQQQHLLSAPTPAVCPPIGCALAPHLPNLEQCDQPVVACDLASAQRCLADWCSRFPGVHASTSAQTLGSWPLTHVLALSGRVSFRAYSKSDLNAAVSAGVPGHAILLANPCKTRGLARHARRLGVGVTVFDSEPELARLAAAWPDVELLLLLAASPRCHRLGARPEEAPRLLAAARRHGLRVAGVAVWFGDDNECEGDDGGEVNSDVDAEWAAAASTACGTLALARRLGHANADVVDLGCLSTGALAGRALPAFANAVGIGNGDCQPRLLCDLTPALLAESVVMATRVLAKAAAEQPGCGGYSYRLSGPGLGGQLCGLFSRECEGGGCSGSRDGVPSRLADCGGDPLNLVLPELSVGDWLLWRGLRACPTAARLMHCLFTGELMETKPAACLEEEPLPTA
ncbi:hypothetical protein BOX15_Mlig015075g3 [Macrostomum lignano]|uniref:Uncharacterized protein n=2 Tax=Macrostomum lignano TaxID=282301 RepID=A0A267DGR2_9PLAT|nr:hypothetical protein BOX15_Mlig015075g5 [Macrostomum lignano]PAA60515.1 hypothetical protein BOX15_Mlig015075g3 [Macrostomum lignano]